MMETNLSFGNSIDKQNFGFKEIEAFPKENYLEFSECLNLIKFAFTAIYKTRDKLIRIEFKNDLIDHLDALSQVQIYSKFKHAIKDFKEEIQAVAFNIDFEGEEMKYFLASIINQSRFKEKFSHLSFENLFNEDFIKNLNLNYFTHFNSVDNALESLGLNFRNILINLTASILELYVVSISHNEEDNYYVSRSKFVDVLNKLKQYPNFLENSAPSYDSNELISFKRYCVYNLNVIPSIFEFYSINLSNSPIYEYFSTLIDRFDRIKIIENKTAEFTLKPSTKDDPKIFSPTGFRIFENFYNEMSITESSSTDLKFILTYMKKDKLIHSTVGEKHFKDYLAENFEIFPGKFATLRGDHSKRKYVYNLAKQI